MEQSLPGFFIEHSQLTCQGIVLDNILNKVLYHSIVIDEHFGPLGQPAHQALTL